MLIIADTIEALVQSQAVRILENTDICEYVWFYDRQFYAKPVFGIPNTVNVCMKAPLLNKRQPDNKN